MMPLILLIILKFVYLQFQGESPQVVILRILMGPSLVSKKARERMNPFRQRNGLA